MKPEQHTLKNAVAEHALVHRRLLLALLVVIGMMGILLWRFYQLQIVHYEKYQTQSQANRVHMQRLAPKRGLILDREQRLLAENQPSYMLVIYRDQAGDTTAVLDALQQLDIIDQQEREAFTRRQNNYRPYEGVPVRLNLDDEAIARFSSHKLHFKGVEIKASLLRYYPQGALLSHMLGYVSRINEHDRTLVDAENYAATEHIGKIGVERSHESELHGSVGYEYVETNARGKVLRTLETTPPVPGQNLVLHLDLELQRAAFAALGSHRGAIVALDTRNGGVLAAASTPSYDANLFARRLTYAQYQALQDDIDLPLFNRILQAQYPPGSTAKPFVGLAGLEEKTITMNSTVYDPGWYQLPNDERFYRDWKRTGHGSRVNFISAMEESCDVYYYDLAYKLGVNTIHQYLDLFGFGKRTGVDVPNERHGINPSPQWKRSQGRGSWFPGDTLNIGIGQGFLLATPMQLAFATSILANRGRVFVPQMVASVGGQPVAAQELAPVVLKNDKNWQNVIDSMIAVVHGYRGTAKSMGRGLSYKMAGKTGTAQVIGIAQGEKYDASQIAIRKRDHALFIAFAPVDNPLIAVAVVVENGEHGSSVAAPMARKVIDLWLQKQADEG